MLSSSRSPAVSGFGLVKTIKGLLFPGSPAGRRGVVT